VKAQAGSRFQHAAVVTAALLCSGCSAGGSGSSLAAVTAQSAARAAAQAKRSTFMGKFEHVVVIVQENRTVDNLFNGFPGADTVTTGNRYGKQVPLEQIALEPSINPLHGYADFVSDYDDGKMDGFDHIPEAKLGPEGQVTTAYAYVRPSDVADYWTLASRFTLADEVFQMNMGPSFAAHVNLVAAQGGYPLAFAGNAGKIQGLPGCLGTSKIDLVDMRTPFPGTISQGPACQDMQTIFDLLDAKGLDWRYYAPAYGIAEHFWSAPDYVTHIALGPDRAKLVSPESLVLEDIANGTLPKVSYVIPNLCTSDHPRGASPDNLAGPHWVAALTNAIGASKYWGNTLILVTWDDWGGWYDHKTPPILNADQLSFRVPLLIVSAYPAAPGAPDHTTRNQASILTAIESVFKLGSLGQLDAQTDDLGADFNFTRAVKYGAPLPAATPQPGPCQASSYGSGPDAKTGSGPDAEGD
jgi:phospholipase C